MTNPGCYFWDDEEDFDDDGIYGTDEIWEGDDDDEDSSQEVE